MSVRIDDFSILLLVDATRSFSGAAESRHTTQQSISTRIKKLEHELGMSLFERTNHGVRLTPGGKRLLPYARRWVALYEETVDAARADNAVASLRVRVQEAARAMLEGLAFELRYVDVPGEQLLADLEEDRIDLAVGIFEAVPAELVVEEVMTEKLALVVAPDHPLAGRPEITQGDLRGHRVVMASWHERIVDVATSSDGDGSGAKVILAVPSSAVASELEAGTLAELPITGVPRWSIQVQAAFRPDNPHAETISLAVNALSGAFGEAP